MSRRWIAWMVVGMAAAATGCTMCTSDHYECGPLFNGGCSQQCQSTARAGSAFAGSPTSAIGAPNFDSSPGEALSAADRPGDQPPPRPAAAAPATIKSSGSDGWKPSYPREASPRPAGPTGRS